MRDHSAGLDAKATCGIKINALFDGI